VDRLRFLADFADPAVVLPLALLIAAALASSRAWQALLGWLAAVVFMVGAMALLKYFFFACAGSLSESGIHSPSGHVAGALVVYGGATLTMVKGRLARTMQAAVISALAVGLGVILLVLGAHNLAEILIGAFVGLGSLIIYASQSHCLPDLPTRRILRVGLILILACHGQRLQAEEMIEHFGLWQRLQLPDLCLRVIGATHL
jgi:membrane-associated phospholipid phosphatase